MFRKHPQGKQRALIAVALLAAACQAAPVAIPTAVADLPSTPPSPDATADAAPVVPAGIILFQRLGSDGVEHYGTMRTDGSRAMELFTRELCACAHLSPDGTHIWTIGPTDHGTFSLMTMRLDGSDVTVVSPSIGTLTILGGVATPDGRRAAFAGVDDTDPSHNGIWVGSPDLTSLRFAAPIPRGAVSIEVIGSSSDGARIVFFGNRGEGEHEAGDLYAVDEDGANLLKLNPADTTITVDDGFLEGSVSPDGNRVAFGAYHGPPGFERSAIFAVDINTGETVQLSDWGGGNGLVAWSPTGEWIAYNRQDGNMSVTVLVRPDGSDRTEISPQDGPAEAVGAVWSPDGKYILVQRGLDGRYDLWIIDTTGAPIAQVTQSPATYGNYAWAAAQG